MKRSGQVGLVLMGAAAFAATFAGGMAYFAWQKPSHATQAQTAAPAQNCTTRPDGTQNCQSARRGFAYYLFPSFSYGSSANGSSASSSKPRAQSAALSNNSRSYSPSASSGTSRGGFGSTAQSGSYRTSSAGG